MESRLMSRSCLCVIKDMGDISPRDRGDRSILTNSLPFVTSILINSSSGRPLRRDPKETPHTSLSTSSRPTYSPEQPLLTALRGIAERVEHGEAAADLVPLSFVAACVSGVRRGLGGRSGPEDSPL